MNNENDLRHFLDEIARNRNLRHLATRVTLAPPASAGALADIENFITFALTPSHRAFLEKHDGLTIECFDHGHPTPQEAPDSELIIHGCAGIRSGTQHLRDFFELAYVGTIDGVTADTSRRFYAIARTDQLDQPILSFPEAKTANGEYLLVDVDLSAEHWLADIQHPYWNIVDQSFEAFLHKSLECLATGDRFEYWWPPGSWS